MKRTLVNIFRMPARIALASCIGLLSALLADGWADALSWFTLGSAAAVGIWHALRRDQKRAGLGIRSGGQRD